MRFSVIVPLYNVESYIGECIKSLLRQTYGDFEVLVIDDASTDLSLATAMAYADEDPRFRFFRQSANSGLSAVRNVGIEQARGDYLLFLDSDDFYVDDALEALAKRLDQDNLDQLFFAAMMLFENRRLMRERPEQQENRTDVPGVRNGVDFYVEFERTDAFRPSACMYALRRSIVMDHDLRFKEGILHEDLPFTLSTIPFVERVAFLNEPLYVRRMREGSIMTTSYTMENVESLLGTARDLEAWLYEDLRDYPDEFRRALAHRIFDTYDFAGIMLGDIPQEQIDSYRATLTPEERAFFDLRVAEVGKLRADTIKEYTECRTYRVGRAITALPVWIRDHLAPPKRPSQSATGAREAREESQDES